MHSPTAIEEYGDDYGSKIVVGTGPFKWVEWTGPNGIFTAERNDDYNWAPVFYNHQGPPYLDGFTWKGILEVSTRSAAVESGDVDIATVAEKDIPRFNSLDGFKVEPLPRGNLVFQINFDSPILADLRVREALSHAIDRQAIIDSAIYAGFGEPANSVLTPRVWGDLSEFDQYNRFYDPDKANALLEEAGWIDSDGDGIREANGVEGVEDGTPLVLKDVVLVELLPLAEILQGMFLEVGIKTELEVNQFDIWYNNREEGNFDISLHTQDPGDLFYLQPYYATDGTENDGDYQNPDIDAQYAIALGTTDVDVQRAAIRQVQIDILEDLAFIPVISPVWPWAMKEGVNSLDVDTFGIGLYLYDTWIDPNP